ncbi:YciK family oxidoreductase [Alteromonas facilis]|uniref:YciK family oxidoreductase n=1 Tax=Alteromonas facilis TaxID=2048004 RepID=UPI000C2937DB|nr:YciK family oxidoreductase [Alteromonas facilis]
MLNNRTFTREINIANEFSPSPLALKDKTILITGAGDGIGKALAISFANLGATIILLGKTVSKLEAVYDEIIANGGQEPAIVPLDLRGASPQHYIDMGNTIVDQFGHLDGLVLNAGILGALCPFTEISQEEYADVMQVNVHSSFSLLQGVIPALKRSPTSASVILTTSTVGREGRKFWGTYSISKFATEGMMEVLADEYKASDIRFNCVNPGGTRTDMRSKAFPAEDAMKLKTPAEIVATYNYLMTEESAQITGKIFDCQPK